MNSVSREYHHKPYKSEVKTTGLFFLILEIYIVAFTGTYLLIHLLQQPFMQVKEVSVLGVKTIEPASLSSIIDQELQKNFFYIFPKNNILFFPNKAIREHVFQYSSRVKNVTISSGIRTAAVSVEEYIPAYFYCPEFIEESKTRTSNEANVPPSPEDNATTTATSTEQVLTVVPKVEDAKEDDLERDCYWADREGYLFALAPIFRGAPLLELEDERTLNPTPTSYVGTQVQPLQTIQYQSVVRSILEKRGLMLKKVVLLNDDDIALTFGYPWVVFLSMKKPAEESADHLLLVLKELGSLVFSFENTVHTIDLRFGNKVFYK